MVSPLPVFPRVSLRKVKGRKVVNNKEYRYEYYMGMLYIPKHVGEYIEENNIKLRAVVVPAEVADRVAEEAEKIIKEKEGGESVGKWIRDYLSSRGK